MVLTPPSRAAMPLFTYEGYLTDSDDTPLKGTYTARVKLYDSKAGACLLYSKDNLTIEATDPDGYFRLDFGEATTTFNELFTSAIVGQVCLNNSSLTATGVAQAMSIEILNPGTGAYEILNGFVEFASLPYALRADYLGDRAATDYMIKPSCNTANQVLKFDGSGFVCGDISGLGMTAGTTEGSIWYEGGLIKYRKSLGVIETLGTTSGTISGDDVQSGTIGGNTAISTSGNIVTTGTMTAGTYATTGTITANTAVVTNALSTTSISFSNALSPGQNLNIYSPTSFSTYSLTLPSGAPTANQILQSDGSGNLSWYTLPASNPGTVTSVSSGDSYLSVINGSTTPSVTANVGTTSNTLAAGDDSRITGALQKTAVASNATLFDGKLWIGDATGKAQERSFSGDVHLTNTGMTSVMGLRGTTVSSTAPSFTGHVLRFNSGTSQYEPAFLSFADIRSTITPTNSMFPATSCTTGQTLTWSSLTDTMTCTNISIAKAAVSGLGSAADFNVGISANNIVQLDSNAKLPALDGSQLTNLNTSSIATGTLPLAHGGTGSIDGSISGTSALNFVAGGSNQNITLTPSGTGNTILNGNVGIGTTTPSARLDVKGELRLSGATTGYVGFKPASAAGSTVWELPATDGTSGQLLSTNGAGVLSWYSPTGGGGTVTNVSAASTIGNPITVTNNASTPIIDIPSATSSLNGYLSSTDWSNFNSKLGTSSSFSGDVSGTYNALVVNKISGVPVSASATLSGQVLRFNNSTSQYEPAFLSFADIRSTVPPNNSMFPTTSCTTGQTLTWSSLTDTMTCANIAIAKAAVSGLGSAADYNVGTSANNIVQLDSSAKLPALDGSQLTNLNTSSIATGTLPLANGGTGSIDGSISGTSALNFVAGGSNQNITLTPSGIGNTILNGKVGIGTAVPWTNLSIYGSDQSTGLTVKNADSTSPKIPNVAILNYMGAAEAGFPKLILDNNRGSSGAVQPLNAGNTIGVMEFRGRGDYASGGSHVGATIRAETTNNWDVSNQAPTRLLIATAPNNGVPQERLVIESNGNVGIGTVSPTYTLDVNGDINTSTCFRIGPTAVSGSCSSDARLKENIQDYRQGLQDLLTIRLRTYQFNGLGEMPKTGETTIGVIAQEVEKNLPELVKTRQVKMHPDDQDKTEIKVVDYSRFTYMLINAVKELYQKIVGVEQSAAAQDHAIEILRLENQNLKNENATIKSYLCAKDPSAPFCRY